MNLPTFIVEFLKALAAVLSAVAWPGVVLVALFLFKADIGERIRHMRRAGRKGFEFDSATAGESRKKLDAAQDLDRAAMTRADEFGLAALLAASLESLREAVPEVTGRKKAPAEKPRRQRKGGAKSGGG